ncbi:hypothetical protein HT136_24765 [Novosphingobium profundi]|uniref:hypothetical protein n=1 Tax=Novosphingobium profundi TaxID=1774954 RepID=UPI001BDA2CEC|nr:hypothetical protein [Novosphingobium profundi]MBT0671587.1 hypothetical protein [Novosphingobium profundi]
MSKKGSTVYPLRLSESGFAITVRAIQELSLRSGKYETLPGVIARAVTSDRDINSLIIKQLDGEIIFDGDIKISLRLDNEIRDLFRDYQERLSAIVEQPLTVRDCAVLISLQLLNEL